MFVSTNKEIFYIVSYVTQYATTAIDETSEAAAAEEPPAERGKMKLLVGMEAAHFTWNVGDGKQVAGYPLPCSGVFVAGLFDDRYMLGADACILYPAGGTATNMNLEVLGRFGMFSPVKGSLEMRAYFL